MANNLGRISGQLLKDNLTRNGHDLSFHVAQSSLDTPLLKLNVTSRYIGINTDAAGRRLQIDGTTRTTDLIVDNTFTSTPNITISNNEIASDVFLNVSASGRVYADRIKTDQLEINNNTIYSLANNDNIDIEPVGIGTLEVYNNLNITGNLRAWESAPGVDGNITLAGSIIFGNNLSEDTVSFAADINSDIIPNVNAPAIDYPPAITATWHSVRFKYDPTGYTNLFLFWYIANTPWNLWVDANVQIGNHVYATRNGVRKYYGTVTAKPVIPGISAGDQITFTVSNPENHPAYFDYPDPIYPTTFEISAVPDGVRGFSLGANPLTGNRWKEIYPLLVNGQAIDTGALAIGNIDPALRPGKIWYVSVNGNDSNVGNHAQGPFLTIKHALLGALPGDEVFIFPGTYAEIFPLTVPVGVSVNGTGIRAVTIVPTVGTNNKDAFLLNGETTVSDLTVKDFYYDSGANTGYAFRFASGFTVTSRSPYVQNCSVITSETTTGALDAGRGALVDGAVANTSTKEASMLFHSMTMIVPNADALTMTNGVRVEWLNSFTYFANIGLHAVQGAGRYDANTSTTRYGAEVRSIGSANVYGNYGAYAEGADTLMYLINHNFGYIGAGLDSNNDPSLNNHPNEVVQIGGGKIYYQSLDNKGNFQVGEAFKINYETGRVTFNGVSVSAGGVSSIGFATEGSTTVVESTQISTGSIKFSGHTISSLYGPVNLLPSTNELNIPHNAAMTKDLGVDGDFSVEGTLTIGNQVVDRVQFSADVVYDLRPDLNNTHSLGSSSNKWLGVYVRELNIGTSLKISGHTVETLGAGADLRLEPNGNGVVVVPSNNVEITNNLQVDGTTNLSTTGITGIIELTGTITKTGNTEQTGDIDLTGHSTISSTAKFADVQLDANTVSTLTGNNDLQLIAAGTGRVYVPSNNLKINQNLTVVDTITAGSIVVHGVSTATLFDDGDIHIHDNIITTTVGSYDLELGAAGSGVVQVDFDNTQFDHDLTVDGTTSVKNTVVGTGGLTPVPKNISLTGDYLQTGDELQTGNRGISAGILVRSNAYFPNISLINNIVSTRTTDTDLQLKAVSTGIIDINDNATFSQNLRVNSTTYTNGITNSGIIASDTFSDGDIEISTNNIKTTVGNNNLRLLAAGIGIISVPNDAVEFTNNLTVNGTTSLKNTVIGTGGLTPAPKNLNLTGNYLQTGNTVQTGNRSISVTLDVDSNAYFDSMSFVNNVITTTDADTDLSLKAVGTGLVVFDENTTFSQGLSVATLVVNGLTNSGITTAGILFDNDIQISTNNIKTTVGNNDLRLLAAGTGIISVPNDAVQFDNNLTVGLGTSLKNTVIGTGGLTPALKDISLTGNYLQTGNTLQTGNRSISAQLLVRSNAYFDSMSFVNNVITTTDTNTDLSLKAAGSGLVIFDENTTFSQRLTVDTLVVNGLTNSGTITSDIFTDGDIEINDNYITTTIGDNDLRLTASGIGKVSLTLDPMLITQALTVQDTSILKSLTINGDLTHTGGTTQTGNVTQTGNFDLSNNLTVTGTDAFFTDVRIINNRIATSTGNNNLELRANGNGIIKIADSATFGQTLTVNGITTTSTISALTRTITSDIFTDGDIEINDNYITTTVGNNNLILTANGTGGAKLEKLKFNSTSISTESTNESIILSAPAGSVLMNAVTALTIPAGTTVNRPTLTQGELRFNSTDNLFRGYSTATISFAGVYSADRLTKVLAHPTNNTIGFTTNNNLSMTVSSTGFTVNSLAVDDILFDTNIISTTANNSDITLTANGSGYIKIFNLSIDDNNITNLDTVNPIILENTNNGYVKFSGKAGLAIPSGNNASRPLTPETGDMRWNTQLSTAEVFNGIAYQTLSGDGGDLLNAEEVQEATNLWALVLG